MDCAQILPHEDAVICWRCGTEVDRWLQILPVPRSTNTIWCAHCYIEVVARLDADSSTGLTVTVEVEISLLFYVVNGQPPKVTDEFGTRTVPRLMRGRWELEGGGHEVPAAEVDRLRHWWPQLMAYWEGE